MPDNATPQQVAEYRKGLGVAEVASDAKAEAYIEAFGVKLPEGISAGEKAMIAGFAKDAYEAGGDPRSVKIATDYYVKQQAEQAKVIETVNAGKRDEWVSSLKSELGRDYEPTIAAAEAYMNKLVGGDEALKAELLNAQLAGGGKLGDHPTFAKMVADLALQNGFGDRIEANAIESGGKSLAEQHQELEALMTKDPARYNLPETQSKLTKLIDLRVKRGELDSDGNEVKRRRSA